jgi:hypothetical protein
MYGQQSSTDPIRIVRYSAGLRTSTNVLTTTNTSSDIGSGYMSVKVVYTPSTNTWQLYARIDGTSSFQDPASGSLTLVGSGVNSLSTATSLPLIGAFWNTGIYSNTASFDNVKVTVAVPSITSISPTSKVAGSSAFTLTVNGTNFINGSTVKWNGVNRTTTYISPTQLTASIPVNDILTAGTATITVATGAAVSNSKIFTIDPPAVPSISTSTSGLNPFLTITGTASASQNFTTTGSNLTGNITITAPANFEVSLNNSTYTASVLAPAATTTIYVRVKSTAPAGLYSDDIILTTNGGATKQIDVSAVVLSAEPTTSPNTVTFTNRTSISVTVNWVDGNGANHIVVVRQGGAVNSVPADGTTYSASAAFESGSEIGDGNYVAYKGTGNSFSLTGLNPATIYYVAVYGLNGSAGTENYRTTSPATGNVTTQNAPDGLQITAVDTAFKVDFDNTVEGINNGTYSGGGYAPNPDNGELDSNGFFSTAYTSGAATFGIEPTEDSPEYGHGVAEGNVTDGGYYSFEVAPDNFAFGYQPSVEGYGTGSTTMRMQNQTATAITSLNIGFTTYIYNDKAGINSYNFSHSANNSTYTSVATFDMNSTPGADAAPGWKAHSRVVTLTGLSIAPGAYYYIRWNTQNVSGTAFDEVALDDIIVVANPVNQFASYNGNIETFILAGNAKLAGNAAVNNTIAFVNGKVIIGANTLTLNGTVNNAATGGIRGGATSNLIVGGTNNKTLSFDQTTVGTTNLFNNFTIATTGSVTTAAGNSLAVNGTLLVDNGQTLNLGTNTLTGVLATITNNGTITTQNTTATPVASGKTWWGTGTFNLNAASAQQTLVSGTYNGVTVSTTGGAVTTTDVTVNGTLHLPNANPSATTGALAVGNNFILFMGANAINTGTGDVSGIITRNTGITANTLYTFGHPNSSIIFAPAGTLPTSLSIKTTLGSAPVGKPDGVLRYYDFIQTGASGTKAVVKAHYLDSELNGNTENKLVNWVIVNSPLTLIEQSRSNYNTTENWVELGNVNMGFFSNNFDNRVITLGDSQVATSVWNGSVSDSWTTAANWTPNATPSDLTKVIIPDAATTPNDPTLNDYVTIGTLTIEAGGIVNDWPAGSDLAITGSTGAWINNGTFNAGTSTVTFNTAAVNGVVTDATIAGSTNFNNLTIASGTTLRPLSDTYIGLTGAFTKTGSFIAGSVHNTFEYKGTNQTIVVPNGTTTAYNNLVISGTGAIVPATLNINGNLTTNAAVNFAGTTVTLAGTDEENEYISGTVSPVFNNLVINKSIGEVDLATDIAVSGILTLTSGIFEIGNYDLTLGASPVAGSFSVNNMIASDGEGVVRRAYTGTGSYLFPVGEKTSTLTYSPVTVNVTSGMFNNAYVAVNVADAKHPENNSTESYLTRYWNVNQTGISNAVATITAQYIGEDAVGGEANLAAAQLNASFDVVSSPWIKFSALSGNMLTATNVSLPAGQTAAFTGITAQNPTVEVFGGGTFCQNESVSLTGNVSGGAAPYYYVWSNGLGSSTTTAPSTAVVGATTYTLTVRDANGIVTSDTADVIVAPNATAGTLTGNQTICEGTAEAITLTGYTGDIIRWERSTDTGFTNPTFIAVTSSALSSEDMGNLNGTRYFRAVIQSGNCAEVYSNYITVTVSSTTWSNDTWSNGAPTNGVAAIFTSDYNVVADIVACSIQVTNNANVVIPTGSDVTLTGRITVASGTFTLEDNANLVQLTDVENVGEITVKQNGSSLFKLDYTGWSSPVDDQNLAEFSPATMSNRFYNYGVTASQGDAYVSVDPFANSFQAGKGYLIRMPNEIEGTNAAAYTAGTYSFSFEGVFTGVPNNGIVEVPLANTSNRFNFVGNPYPSPINIQDFFDGNADVLDPSAALYFWRKRNNGNETSYATITRDAYTYNQAVGGGQEWDELFNNSNENEWVINTGQAFFVKVKEGATGPVQFTNDMRRADAHNNQFFRNGQEDIKSRFWLNLTGDNRFSQTAVVYSSTATLGIDYGRDGRAFSEGVMTIYSMIDDANMSIQARPAFNVGDIVPLGVKVATDGTYTITLHRFDGVFEEGQDIYLRDNLTATIHNLTDVPYQFTAVTGTDETRFEVIYSTSQLGTNDPVLNADEIIVWKKDKTINITSGSAIMKDINVFDVRGRLIYDAKVFIIRYYPLVY